MWFIRRQIYGDVLYVYVIKREGAVLEVQKIERKKYGRLARERVIGGAPERGKSRERQWRAGERERDEEGRFEIALSLGSPIHTSWWQESVPILYTPVWQYNTRGLKRVFRPPPQPLNTRNKFTDLKENISRVSIIYTSIAHPRTALQYVLFTFSLRGIAEDIALVHFLFFFFYTHNIKKHCKKRYAGSATHIRLVFITVFVRVVVLRRQRLSHCVSVCQYC